MPLLPPQNTLKQLYGNEDISFHTERWNISWIPLQL